MNQVSNIVPLTSRHDAGGRQTFNNKLLRQANWSKADDELESRCNALLDEAIANGISTVEAERCRDLITNIRFAASRLLFKAYEL